MFLLLLSGILTLFPTNMPLASALGCFPDEFFKFEGPFNVAGDVKQDGAVQTRDGTLQVFVMNPGGSASINYQYFYWNTIYIFNATIKPIVQLVQSGRDVPELPPWLNIYTSPETVLQPGRRVNITATLNVRDDAPAVDYQIDTYGEISPGCGYGSGMFMLRVEPKPETKTTTITTTITQVSTATTTQVEKVTDPLTYAWAVGATVAAVVLAAIVVVLPRRKT